MARKKVIVTIALLRHRHPNTQPQPGKTSCLPLVNLQARIASPPPNMSRTTVRKACELPRFHTRDRSKSHDHDTDMLRRIQVCSDRERDSEQPHYFIVQRADSMLERSVDWSLKVIGALCALIFGVWAPLAYQLQREGNAGDDAAQQDTKELKEEVASLSAQLRMLGMLRAWEVCQGDEKLVCTYDRCEGNNLES
jgi:hypothetical protein